MGRPIEWVFDVLLPSMARRGGDPASHAFRQNMATFVREVVQNSNDQAIEFPEVHFRFVELEGPSLDEFQRAISWQTLEPHLRAAGTSKGGRHVRQFLEELAKRRRLVVLNIEDRNTVGLTGDELTGDSHFRALCKDTLYSHKRSEGAGGSYGLGKSVLWAFSGLSTVLFNSNLSEDPKGKHSPRLIGRTELPSHGIGEKDADWFGGAGWFGERVDLATGARAESVWHDAAKDLAQRLHLPRNPATGTSLLIVGFRDPTADSDASVEELAADTRKATARHFWPAITMPRYPLVVWVATAEGGTNIGRKALDALPSIRPFVECYAQRDSERETLDEPGDVVVREIPLELPGRRDGGAAVRGHVRLCVRLADEKGPGDLMGRVAWFRKPGMVVRYWDRRSLALGVRPFHAVLACGEARDPESPTVHDRDIERFLRAAEPPGHDDWDTTAALKSEYKRGYAGRSAVLPPREIGRGVLSRRGPPRRPRSRARRRLARRVDHGPLARRSAPHRVVGPAPP